MPNGIFGQNLQKRSAYSIKSRCQISLWTSNFEFLDQLCLKNVLKIKTKKSEYPSWILHIGISLSEIFQVKLTIMIFLATFAQKGYFQSKANAMNTTIEFWTFELA